MALDEPAMRLRLETRKNRVNWSVEADVDPRRRLTQTTGRAEHQRCHDPLHPRSARLVRSGDHNVVIVERSQPSACCRDDGCDTRASVPAPSHEPNVHDATACTSRRPSRSQSSAPGRTADLCLSNQALAAIRKVPARSVAATATETAMDATRPSSIAGWLVTGCAGMTGTTMPSQAGGEPCRVGGRSWSLTGEALNVDAGPTGGRARLRVGRRARRRRFSAAASGAKPGRPSERPHVDAAEALAHSLGV